MLATAHRDRPVRPEGRAATADVFPGHQLKLEDFEAADGVRNRLAGLPAAMTVPVDRAHGMVGKIDVGDRVDVITTVDTGAGVDDGRHGGCAGALVLAVPDGEG